MKTNVENFLEELYQIDPSLQEKEAQIKKLIITMTSLSPDVKMDEKFKTNLRAQIAEKIHSEKLKNYEKSNKPSILQIIGYMFGGVWVAAFWFFMFQDQLLSNPVTKTTQEVATQTPVKFENTIIKAQANSYGKLNAVGTDKTAKWSGNEALAVKSADIAAPKAESMEINTFAAKEDSLNSKVALTSPVANDLMIEPLPYVPEIYRYTFSGELNLEIPQNMTVYKKENTKSDTSGLVGLLKNINFSGVNLANFANLNISSLSVNEDKEFGYSLNLDFDNSGLSIWKNWTKWPAQNLEEAQKLPLLTEAESLAIAKNFLSQYNIDLSSYGTPVVEQSYMAALLRAADTKIAPDFYRPAPTVIYPLLIDGKEVREEYGQATGVRVEIDPVEKKVSGVNGLSVAQYLASEYQVENNVENILKVANVWGRWGFYDYGTENVKITNVLLKNPKITYINSYSYKNNVQEQYVIPTVTFEVEKPADVEYFYQETITVPLVKDMYKYDDTGKIIGSSEY